MKNKVISLVLFLVSILFFLLTFNQYNQMNEARDLYIATANSVPSVFSTSFFIWFVPGVVSLFFSGKFFFKKN